MYLVKLGLKNLSRHKKRTLITALSIAIGLAIFVASDSSILGMEELAFNNIIQLETAHLGVFADGYWEERNKQTLDHLIASPEDLMAQLRENPSVVHQSPRVTFNMVLNNGFDEMPVTGIGMNPEVDAQIFKLSDYLIEGRMLQAGQFEAVLGHKLAALMGFSVGDYMTIITKTKKGAYQAIEVELVGLVDSPNPAIDESITYLPLDVVQSSLDLGTAVTEISVLLQDRNLLSQLTPKLTQQLTDGGFQVDLIGWETRAKGTVNFIRSQRSQTSIIMLLILIVAVVGVVNTIMLASLERTEEVGVLKAMGLKRREIVFNFMVEGLGIGLLGGIIGSILGGIGVFYLTQFGMDISLEGMPISEHFYGKFNPSIFIVAILFGGIVAFVASIIPAYKVAKKNPIDAIYHR